MVAENLSGGASDGYDVTNSLTIVASPYDGLTVTVDGQAVDLSQYVTNGITRYEVNFSDILAAWDRGPSRCGLVYEQRFFLVEQRIYKLYFQLH